MKLRRLELERSRGLDAPLAFEDLSPGFNLIVGPNGSGKSSLCRAVAALLWDTGDFEGAVRGTWELAGVEREVLRESGAPPRWSKGPGGPPALPESIYRGCFTFSVDDFLTDSATDGEIQRVIRTELSAGFDLVRVLAGSRRPRINASYVSQRKNELRGAQKEVERKRDEHRELLRREQGLEQVSGRLREATRALQDASLYRDALELAQRRAELHEAEAELAKFPPEMGELRGDEGEQLERLRAAMARAELELGELREAAAQAEEAQRAASLDGAVPPEDLQLFEEREGELRGLDQQLAAAAEEESRAAGAIQEGRRVLQRQGAPPQARDEPEFGAERWTRLEQHLRELQKLEARLDELEARELDPVEAAADLGAPTEAPFVEGQALLARWLEDGGRESARPADLVLVLGGALLIALALFGLAGSAASLAIGGALFLLGAWRMVRNSTDERGRRVREFLELPFDPPAAWEPLAVATRLRELQRAALEQEERRRAQEERRKHARQREKLEQQRDEAAAGLAQLAQGCGLDPDVARLGLVEIAADLQRASAARRAFSDARATREALRTRRAQLLGRSEALLERYGLEEVRDAAELRARKDALTRREQARAAAVQAQAEAERQAARRQAELDSRRAELEAFLAERALAGVQEAELARRLEQLEAWSAARELRDEKAAQVRRLEALLEAHPELVRCDLASARRVVTENEELAATHGELQGEVSEVRLAIEAARKGHALEEALAREAEAHDKLAETRDELFEAAAADFLLEDVARDHESLAQPDLLREVGRLFAEFTRHRYELLAAPYSGGDGLPFEIRESEGRTKAFSELSSGTRSQLGLALRLAVAQSVEEGERLPLFLDEALTNSDPMRFRDVVRSLADLVRGGRQIVFLTADDTDAQRLEQVLAEEGLEPPRRYELDGLRVEARRAERVETRSLPAVPAPEPDESRASYGERLGVPAIELFEPVDALHPFYLCGEDLAGLHELLVERVETVGKARSLLAADPRVWSAARRARFESLRGVAAAWLDDYRIGRAPATPPEVLRRGPVGKTKYIDGLVEILAELGGDGIAVVQALELPSKQRDDRLKGFKAVKLDELRADLEAQGLFTGDDPRPAEARLERCLTAAKAALEGGVLEREDVFALANDLEQWLET